MSAFDPAAYEQAATDDASSTSVTPIDAGEYLATIKDYKFRTITSKKTQEESLMCDVQFFLLDDTGVIKEKLGRDPILTHGYFVDTKMGPDGKQAIDFSQGKNVWLGRLREAIGQNAPGFRWSFPMIRGQVLRIVVIQDPAKDSDDIYNRVKSVGRAG